jgi:hypothetical protein
VGCGDWPTDKPRERLWTTSEVVAASGNQIIRLRASSGDRDFVGSQYGACVGLRGMFRVRADFVGRRNTGVSGVMRSPDIKPRPRCQYARLHSSGVTLRQSPVASSCPPPQHEATRHPIYPLRAGIMAAIFSDVIAIWQVHGRQFANKLVIRLMVCIYTTLNARQQRS